MLRNAGRRAGIPLKGREGWVGWPQRVAELAQDAEPRPISAHLGEAASPKRQHLHATAPVWYGTGPCLRLRLCCCTSPTHTTGQAQSHDISSAMRTDTEQGAYSSMKIKNIRFED